MSADAILVFDYLLGARAVSMFTAKSVEEIQSAENCCGRSVSTIYRVVSMLFDHGYVALGAKRGRVFTYYLTEKGIEFYEKEIACIKEDDE